jgi:type II secretory pathway pseudopilin PulG
MVEILIAVAIVALLAGGMFFVSGKATTQAKIHQTQSTLMLLDTALEQYYDYYKEGAVKDHYPPDVNYASSTNTRDILAALNATTISMNPSNSNYVADYNDAQSIEVLYYYLNRVPQSRVVLGKLADTAISAKAVKLDGYDKPLRSKASDPNVVITISSVPIALFRIIDPWNMPLQYIRYRADVTKETTNFPLIRSAGPDKVFGTTDDIINKKD